VSEDFSNWRDPQGFTRTERTKEERARALRERFSLITHAYERSIRRATFGSGLLIPAILGLAAGGAAYLLVWW
jgi:hypothetical protein